MQEITREDVDILVRLQKAETETVRIQSFLKKIEKEKLSVEKELVAFETALGEHRDAFNRGRCPVPGDGS